ncbi:MAG: type IV secretory system conjugative DNA transfer family protein [Clostridiales bacterium]|jgi:type IV secretion system protein VirD4|nr:type IV secretory system conjugative DNA transfer family protein [Clostridiales bacterium]
MSKVISGARFATQEEFLQGCVASKLATGKFAGCGIPIWSSRDIMYTDNSESHALAVGSTGTGKSSEGAIPAIISMLRCGESVIATDIKSELYAATSGIAKEMGYKIVVLNFSDPLRSHCWNPLSEPYQIYKGGTIKDVDEAALLVYDIAYGICSDPKAKDRYWDLSSVEYTNGLIMAAFEDAEESEINMRSIAYMSSIGESMQGNDTVLKKYFSKKDKNSIAYTSVVGTINVAPNTRSCIISTDRRAKRIFLASQGLSKMLSGMDFSFKELSKEKTIVYIICPGGSSAFSPIVSCFVSQAYNMLVHYAQEEPDNRLARRFNFVLDEFGNLVLNDFPQRISLARGYNIRFLLFIQNLSQLQSKYSSDEMETIFSNCLTKIYYNA